MTCEIVYRPAAPSTLTCTVHGVFEADTAIGASDLHDRKAGIPWQTDAVADGYDPDTAHDRYVDDLSFIPGDWDDA